MSDKRSFSIAYSMKKKAKKMAQGDQSPNDDQELQKDEQMKSRRERMLEAFLSKKMEESQAPQDESMEQDPQEQDEMVPEDEDMVSRIMKKRHKYSEGGKVANEDQGESASIPDQMAKAQPNEFDDLALRDDLEFNYDGENSGDELGNDQEDMDRKDIVARIMASRKKKDHLPNPA